MRPLLPRNAFMGRDAGWCLRANRWGEWAGVRRFFAVVSRLGDRDVAIRLLRSRVHSHEAVVLLHDRVQSLEHSDLNDGNGA